MSAASSPASSSSSSSSSEEDPREHAARVERLLGDVRAMVGPVAWPRVEELVSRLVALYGSALGRVLFLVGEAGALDPALRARLCEDELVGALMALHGIHPTPVAERVRGAVARVRAKLGSAAGELEAEVDERGTVRVQLAGSWRCALPRAAVDEALRRAIEEAAPEVAAIEIDGVDWTPAAAAPLVQLDLARSQRRMEPAS